MASLKGVCLPAVCTCGCPGWGGGGNGGPQIPGTAPNPRESLRLDQWGGGSTQGRCHHASALLGPVPSYSPASYQAAWCPPLLILHSEGGETCPMQAAGASPYSVSPSQ